MIVSRQNQKVKDIRRVRRCKGDAALLEGPHLVQEASAAGIDLQYAVATPDFLASAAGTAITKQLDLTVLAIESRLLSELCDSDSPRGIVAVAELPRAGVGSMPIVDDGLYVYVDGIQDPGNLGALCRAAEAFGVVALCLSPSTAHPNHPRALRASAGSLLRIPIAVGTGPSELSTHLDPTRPRWVALVPRGGTPVPEIHPSRPMILAVGAEGPGLSRAARERAEVQVTIPVSPPVESLNAAVAAAIVLYELAKTSSRP